MRNLIFFVISAIVQVGLFGQAVDINSGLVGHWPMDEVSQWGVTIDHSGNNAHGSVTGAGHIPGIMGGALKLDGVNDMVTILDNSEKAPAQIASLGVGSISIWFRLDRLNDGKGIQPIFYFGSLSECANMFDAANQGIIIEVGHHPVHASSNRLYFTIFGNGCSLPSFCFDSWVDMEPERWYHFVAVVGEDFNTGYLDGKPMEYLNYNFGTRKTSQFFEDAWSDDVIWLGKGYWDAEPYYLDGTIDDLRIYNRALSANEVGELYEMALSTGVDPLSGKLVTGIYPNPANERLNTGLPAGTAQEIKKMVITDVHGITVRMVEPGPTIDLEGMVQGIYFLVIESNSGVQRVSFVKTD
jgi:hypothetical protein